MPAETKKRIRSCFAGKYSPRHLDFIATTLSSGGAVSPVLHTGFFAYLQKNDLVEMKMTLTEKGKWVAMAYAMNVSFFTLSALADFYCMQKSAGFAVSPKFLERFEPYYSTKHISNTISSLARRGLVYRSKKHVWRITPKVFERLQKEYDGELTTLKQWLDKIQDEADESVMQNPLTRMTAIKNAFFLGD